MVYSHNQPLKKHNSSKYGLRGKIQRNIIACQAFPFHIQHFPNLTIEFHFIKLLLKTGKNRSNERLVREKQQKPIKIMCNNYNCTEFLSNFTEGVIDKHCNINHSLPFLFTVISLLYMVTLCVISLHMWCVHLGIITLMHCCLPLQKASK